MVQVPLLLFCFGMVQHSLADADALNDSCTVHRIEKSMYGTGSEPYYCTPNAKRFSKIEHKKFKLAMQCYYECMEEYTITQLNETFGWLQPAVANCTVDLSDRKCRAFPLDCTWPLDSFPNACSGSLGRYAPVFRGKGRDEFELELYLGLYSYSRLSWFGRLDRVLETRLDVEMKWASSSATKAACSSFYSTGSDSSCLGLSGESSKAVMPLRAPVPPKARSFFSQQWELKDYQLTSCTLVTYDDSCDALWVQRESPDPLWEVMDELRYCLRPSKNRQDWSEEFRLEWHIDEGVTLLTIDKTHCPRIAMNCSKPLDGFPNACSGSFTLKGSLSLKEQVFFVALYSYIKHDNEGQAYQAIEMRIVMDQSVCNTTLEVRSHTGACLGLRGFHKLPLEDEIDWEATEPLEPPEMAEMPRPFRDPPSTSTLTVTTVTETKTSTSTLMDVPPPEDHGKDSKPSPSEPKPSEASKSTLWPFLKIVALSLMLLGATAAFLWYRRRQGTQAATLQTQEVEIQEIRRA